MEKEIDGKAEGEWSSSDKWTDQSAIASEVSRQFASNIWEAQILKCTPDAIFKKPQWYTDAFDFANPGASRFSTTKVKAVTLAAYSNAIERIRDRFLGTNMVVCSSSGIKTPVVITDIRAGIVPPVLDIRLDSMPDGDEAMGIEALKALSNEIMDFVSTLLKLGKLPEAFFPRFLFNGRDIPVMRTGLTEKQLAGGLFQAGMYWAKGHFNVPDDSPQETSGRAGDD